MATIIAASEPAAPEPAASSTANPNDLNDNQSEQSTLQSEEGPDPSTTTAQVKATPPESAETRTFRLLYLSHFLQAFGDRLWEFSIPLLLTEIFPDTLFPQAVFLFATQFAVFSLIPLIGAWIDSTNRLRVVSITLLIQNTCVGISSGVVLVLAYYHEANPYRANTIDIGLLATFCALVVSAMVGQVMSQGAALSMEKDWIVVLCAKYDEQDRPLLTETNARLRRIDLFCKIVAPALFGVYIELAGATSLTRVLYGAGLIFGWNALSLLIEYTTLRMLYTANRKALSVRNSSGGSVEKPNALKLLYFGWSAYTKSPAFFASFSYAMLYVNVLCGGVVVTAFLRLQGISYSALGIAKGLGALSGILGTLLTPCLHKRVELSMELIGLLTVWLFWATLCPVGVADLVLRDEGPLPFAYTVLCCMIVARLTLWAFDLSITQLMQTKVEDAVRAQVNGAQVALCQIFFMVSSVLTMVFHDVDQFYIVVWVTLATLFVACVMYSLWYVICARRKGYDCIKEQQGEI